MSDPNGSSDPVRTGASAVRGANWNDPARRPPPDFESQRRQRNALIGLGVASAIVLLIGGVAFLASRSGGTGDASVESGPESTSTQSTSPETTTSSTSTTTSAPTTLPLPVDALADAGPDLDVDAGSVVTLQASATTEGAVDDDVTWRQVGGPDVTAGVGALGGRAVSFGAPDDVVTLQFELVVASGDRAATAPEAVDALTIRVFEQADATVFVDAERGDDAADGSMESPLKSLAAAAARASGGADLYVRSIGTYTETESIRLGSGTSLYGGFDENWNRDRSSRVRIDAASVGIIVDGDGDRHVSAVELTAASADAGLRSIGVRVSDAESVVIEDSRIVSGGAGNGTGTEVGGAGGDSVVEASVAGTSVGVLAVDTGEIRIERSTVNGGRGGDGASPTEGAGGSTGESGEDGSGSRAGSGGPAGTDGDELQSGGDGGDGASNGSGDDAGGDHGGAGGDDRGDDGVPGGGGDAGEGGRGGDGGDGLFDGDDSIPIGASGDDGDDGVTGRGGGGGGGGASGAGAGPATGGGGGGGGAGGAGSDGGVGGGGGGGSIGIWAVRVDRVVVLESLIAAGRGGDGAPGAAAGAAGGGGAGGDGAQGDAVPSATGTTVPGPVPGPGAGAGGGGGAGGSGGVGGSGGGGAGGPSSGLLTTGVDDVEIMASTIRGGGGGNGADGGDGGTGGDAGQDGTGRTGAVADGADVGEVAGRGRGASGGSSFGWFDVDAATQTLESAEFIEGVAGAGGRGSTDGEAGLGANANVDAEG